MRGENDANMGAHMYGFGLKRLVSKSWDGSNNIKFLQKVQIWVPTKRNSPF